jgi:pimeloyl-ACP methyl ester carboxylesterase
MDIGLSRSLAQHGVGPNVPLQQINAQWINYEDTGGALTPVAFAHGLLMDHGMFDRQVEALAGAYRVITWDARCHGETETASDPFTFWDLADDLSGLLDHLGIKRAAVGGMGQGGSVALRFALRYPEKVSALLLMGTQAGTEAPEKAALYGGIVEEWDRDGLTGKLAETIGSIILGSESPDRVPWIAKWRRMPRSAVRQAFQALVSREDLDDRLNEIKAHALVIRGTGDAAITVDEAQRLSSRLGGGGPLVAIDGAGHACNLTHPAPVNQAMQQFLGEVGLGTRRAANRRGALRRRQLERRFGERREPVRASAGRRIQSQSDRRREERRAADRRVQSIVRVVNR